ncbi:hypothetical protein QQF64_001746 [Cirrhinus molitorella]|uniref:Ig-like domain-containing protein n=1 Tax=Cirrhinus molitorella TaxID=172907 RepID=A0ABR3P0Y9_9TELE
MRQRGRSVHNNALPSTAPLPESICFSSSPPLAPVSPSAPPQSVISLLLPPSSPLWSLHPSSPLVFCPPVFLFSMITLIINTCVQSLSISSLTDAVEFTLTDTERAIKTRAAQTPDTLLRGPRRIKRFISMHHSESHGHTAEAERCSRTRSLQPPLSPIKSNQKPPSANSDPTSANQRRMAQNHSGSFGSIWSAEDFELSSLYSLSFISRTDEPRDELLSRLPQKHTDTLNEHRHTLLWSLCGFSNEKLRHNRGTGQDETLLLGGSLLFISHSVPFIPETLKDTEMAGTLGIFGICLLFAGAHVTSGITVNIPQKVYKIARGDDVTIPCTFTPPATGSSVIVTWTASSDVPEDPDISIATYFDPTKITIFKKYKGRANLLHDVTKGQANLQLLKVTSADNLVYECKVEFPGDEEGSASAKTRLVVLVAPSTPVCSIVGTAEYFQDIKLTCNSAEGTPTPTYKWESNDVNNIPRPLPLKNKEENGVLSLFNISKDTSGYFFCTSTNEIRSAKCNVTLAVLQPSLTLGSAGTIAIGVAVAALVVFVGIIICCCYCRRRKGKEEEYSMGTPEGGEFTDKDPEGREDDHDKHVNYEEERRVKSADRRDPQDDRSERSYDRRSDYDDRKDNYADRRDDRSDRRDRDDRYDDRRDDRSDRRDRDDRDDRRDDRSNRRDRDDRDDRYDARRDRYDDRRDDRRDHYDDRYDSDRYSERYDSRDRPPSVPPNKPKEPRN